MSKKSSVLRQERRQTGGGEVPKEVELTDFEMRFLEEPILTLPLSTPFDSDSTDIEISNPQYPSTSTSASLIPSVTPSQKTDKIIDNDSSSDPSMDKERKNEEHQLRMEQLRLNMKMDEERKNEEHKLRKMDEERKNEEHKLRKMDDERKNEEHKLRMELLRIQIAQAKVKMKM
ncbi:hypothetical protein TNIN_430521 [Trichonephila inaurata madagascariensis]|uniref:Uncharacterized protein n=1 Tax=Trichonephila inaurata madagascariensis TaxID=2747483 RepID=A0A8X6XUD8_9ARAC|nr:hypothetical protein TNIN_430521 [Trichonephila inaurata madagascariensis]